MATLIQAKQIEGIVTASSIQGDFLVSGSLVVSGSGIFTNDITASGIISASQVLGVHYEDIIDTPNFVAGTGISISQSGNNITITNVGGGGGVPPGTISGSSQLTASYDLRYALSGSSGVSSWNQLSDIPQGLISGSILPGTNITISSGSGNYIISSNGGANTTISDIAPVSANEGDLWWKSDDGNLYVYYDGYWIVAINVASFVSGSTSTIPSGTISGSSQLTASFDSRYVLSGSVSAVPAGTISGSSQLTSSFDSRYSLSGSNFDGGAINNKITLTSAASASGVPLADIEYIKGAFYSVPLYSDLENIPISRISNKQIVWVEEASQTYQATITLANPPITFTDSVVWDEFFGFALAGGDITSVIAGSGLTGGGFAGSVTLNVGAGKGISVSANDVSINTGSAHFGEGVEYWISSGSYIIDSGKI
jgi:hypothetical protein